MTREIKFRAWDAYTKAMREVTSLSFFDEFLFLDEKPNGDYTRLPILGTPLMQYTGLKDKNDKDIYEGDVVKIHNYKENWKRGEPNGDWRIFKVEWNRYLYSLQNEWISTPLADYDVKDLEPWDIEIIGNIYENSNLLDI